ncbi:DUF6759 domain-containing protein [Epilithonimonas sp. UC225_85]|uniref:DUF6759 domain-containing protein n=1 Tax=Epilithonimonas sp. UC225_85 TaxID=3350167 RepID=UPI0036D3922E
MNRFFLFFLGICLVSCASSNSVSPLLGGKDSTVLLNTDVIVEKPQLKIEDKAVTLLNQLFNTDAANKNMVLIINNDSDCDFIMTISGGKTYSVPVASKKTESIVVEQGEYVMRSEVCQSTYLARKTLAENTQLNIKYSLVTTNTENKNPELK